MNRNEHGFVLFKTNHVSEVLTFIVSLESYCDVDVLLLVAAISAVAQMETRTQESWISAPY